ncbi:50S ribosomal protein L23 [Candidatus Gracilibacteria bacterium]|nr:50S ribosomal protein L23 [Candidatus Gracilibacteria bacterium]
MRLYKILKKPIITEKTSQNEVNSNTYVFEVSDDATKIDVKKAIVELYGVEVQSVNMVNTREKFKYGKNRTMQLRKRSSKKAYITLKNEKDKIDFTLIK